MSLDWSLLNCNGWFFFRCVLGFVLRKNVYWPLKNCFCECRSAFSELGLLYTHFQYAFCLNSFTPSCFSLYASLFFLHLFSVCFFQFNTDQQSWLFGCTYLDDETCAPDADNRQMLGKVQPCSSLACHVSVWFWFDSYITAVKISQVTLKENWLTSCLAFLRDLLYLTNFLQVHPCHCK